MQCPRCDLSHSFQYYLFESVRDFVWDQEAFKARLKDGDRSRWPCPEWPLERVLEAYYYVTRMLADSDGKINDEWDETTAELARIVLAERLECEYAVNWEMKRKLESAGKKTTY